GRFLAARIARSYARPDCERREPELARTGSSPPARLHRGGRESPRARRASTRRRGARAAVVVVLVVPTPPRVATRPRRSLGRVLPVLLAAERSQVEERPDGAERLDAPPIREVRVEDVAALAEEGAHPERLAVLILVLARARGADPEVGVEVAAEGGVPG